MAAKMFELTRISAPEKQQEQQKRYKSGYSYQSVLGIDSLPTILEDSGVRKKNDDICETAATSSSPPSSESEEDPTTTTRGDLPPSSSPPCPTMQALKFCSFCQRQVVTSVQLQPSPWSFAVSFFLFMSFGFIALCIIPFIWPLLQVAIHHCPLCNDVLDRKSRVSCVKLRDEVVTVRVGSCALVLSRKYMIICAIMLNLIMIVVGVRWYLNHYGMPDVIKGKPTDASWEDFLRECGTRSFLGNPVRAERKFEDEFADKTVRWGGARMHHIKQGIFGKNFMYLDMAPRQYQRSDLRDLSLIFGNKLTDKVEAVEVGDLLSIEATLFELGTRGRPHLGVLWDFNITTKAANVQPPHEEPASRFIVLRNHLSRPPIDLINFMRVMQQAHQTMHAKQEESETLQIFLPFGDAGFPPIRVIKKNTIKGQNEDEVGNENSPDDVTIQLPYGGEEYEEHGNEGPGNEEPDHDGHGHETLEH